MARITSVIAKNRRKNSDNFIEFLSASLQIQADNTETLKEISVGINKIVDNTKPMELIGSVLKELTSSMGSLVNVLSKNVEQQKTSAFFSGALAKEKEYESKFGKKDLSKAPTKVTGATETDKGSFLSSLLKWLGGLLVVGGGLSWLWQNEEFKTKVINFFGTMIDSIIEGASEIYTFAKNWINDEKNQETIGNFVSGLLNAISKGFELMGDLWKAVVKEYEKEDSPLKKTVNGILESLWGFVKEHPLIALGGALVLFGDKIGALTVGMYAAIKTIELAIAGIAAVARHPLLLAAAGLVWGLDKLADWSEEQKAEKTAKIPQYKKDIENINNPELKKQVKDTIEAIKQSPVGPGVNMTEEDKELQAIDKAYDAFKTEIEKDKLNTETQNIALGSKIQPVVAGPGVTPGTIQPSVTTTPTTPSVTTTPTIPPVATPTPTPIVATPSEKPKTEPQKVSENWQPMGSDLRETETKPTKEKTKTGNPGIDLINELLDEKNIQDEKLRQAIIALASVESSFNVNARGPVIDNPKSIHYGKQAHGLFQIMPATAKEMGYSESEIKDPKIAAKAGLEYFLKNYAKFESIDEAIVAHHAGPGKVSEWRKTGELTGGSKWISNKGYLEKVRSRMGKGEDIISGALGTPGKVSGGIPKSESPFKFDLFGTGKGISTEGSESPMSWFEDIIFNAMTNQSFSPKNTLEKIRAMPRGLINAPPKFSGGLLVNQSLSLLNNLQKPPEININAPNINNGRKQESSKPPENTLVSIFDKEFIEMLMERNVSPNPFLFT